MTVQEIIKALENSEYAYNASFGFRTIDEEYNIGDILPDSREWDDGEATGETLDGTCATGIGKLWYDDDPDDVETFEKALKLHNEQNYDGEHTYLIAGKTSDYGNDPAEIIIQNAEVIAIIK